MRFSKVMHLASVITGFVGVFVFVATVVGGDSNIFGITKMDALACAAILILIATWTQIATIHHIMLEKKGELI